MEWRRERLLPLIIALHSCNLIIKKLNRLRANSSISSMKQSNSATPQSMPPSKKYRRSIWSSRLLSTTWSPNSRQVTREINKSRSRNWMSWNQWSTWSRSRSSDRNWMSWGRTSLNWNGITSRSKRWSSAITNRNRMWSFITCQSKKWSSIKSRSKISKCITSRNRR